MSSNQIVAGTNDQLFGLRLQARLLGARDLWLIMALALVIRLLFFHGISPSDPFTYSSTAWDITQGRWNPTFFYEQTTRWGVLLPMAISYKLFGVSEFSSTLWSLLTSIGTVLIAYLMALQLRGKTAAILAGLLVALFPLEIIYASQPMADCPLSFWLSLSLYLFLQGEDEANVKMRHYLLLGSGISLGIAYATKIVAIFILPFFLLVLVTKRRIPWHWVWLAAGFLLVFAAEYLFFASAYGNGLLRLTLARTDETNSAFEIVGGHRLPTAFWLYLYWMLIDIHYVGIAFIVLVLLVFWQRRTKTLFTCRWLLCWAGVLFAILSFYPLRLVPYVPLVKVTPYILMFSTPLLIVLAVYLAQLKQRTQWLLLLSIGCSGLPFIYLLHQGYRSESVNARAIYQFVQQNPARPLYAHRADMWYLQYFDGFQHNDKYQSFRLPSKLDAPLTAPIRFQGTYVAVNQAMLRRHREDQYPPEILQPPTTWKEVHRFQAEPHWIQRWSAGLLDGLQQRGVLTPALVQRLNEKLKNWWLTDPVIIYSVAE